MKTLRRILVINCLLILSIFWFDAPSFAVLPQNTSEIFNAGLDNVRQENYQEALINFSRVIDRQNNLVGAAYSNRCLINLKLQNDVAAKDDCIAAIKINSDNLEAYLNLGLAYYHLEKYNLAIAQYQQVIQENNLYYRAYYNRGLAYFALNNYQQAIKDYQRALRYFSDSDLSSKSLVYNNLGLTYMIIAQDQEAVSNFNHAIALNSNNYHAYNNRGGVYHRQGKYQAAIKDFTQAVQLQPNFTEAYVHRGIVRHQIQEKNTAVRDLNIALRQYKQQGNSKQYQIVLNLKHKLFNAQPTQQSTVIVMSQEKSFITT